MASSNRTDDPTRLLRLCLAPAALALLAACGMGTAEKSAEEEEEEALPTPVEVAAIARGTVVAQYSGTASLEADGEATAYAKVGGEVLELLVEEGDEVEAGQPVARLDDRRLKLEVQRSRANLQKARQEYQRNVELHEKGLLPAGTFESLKFDLDALDAAYELSSRRASS